MGFRAGKTPSISTLHELFAALGVVALEAALVNCIQAHLPSHAKAIAIDSKQLRGIDGEEFPSVHLVTALSHESSLVLTQEKGAAPNVLAS